MPQRLSTLLIKRRFGPFFVTQFLGAFNDNIFKNGLVVLITFQTTRDNVVNTNLWVNLCAGVFILPFFLFSATAGQISDKYEKGRIIRTLKYIEVLVMLAAIYGFHSENLYLLLTVLFFMGTQSTFFGPIKYSILPQHLKSYELVAGNALMGMGTFIAILLGIIIGSKLISMEDIGVQGTSALLLFIAITGLIASYQIPTAAATDPALPLKWHIIKQSKQTLSYARRNSIVFKSIIGISWFWFFGATLLTQFPNYTKSVLHANEDVYIFLLTLFSLGVCIGAVLCARLSRKRVETRLIPAGSLMLTLFCVDLYLASNLATTNTLRSLSTFSQQGGAFRVFIDIIAIGLSGGLFIVPLYTLVQKYSDHKHRSRIIAANNLLNALSMVISAVLSATLLHLGLSITELFLAIAITNILFTIHSIRDHGTVSEK